MAHHRCAAAAVLGLLPAVLLVRVAASTEVDEVSIMQKLRQAIHNSDPGWVVPVAGGDQGFRAPHNRAWPPQGWQLGDTSHPCSWAFVDCNAHRHITQIYVLEPASDTHPRTSARQQNGRASRGGQDQGHKTRSNPTNSTSSPLGTAERPGGPGPLLPELAQLQWLESLVLNCLDAPAWQGLPAEWGRTGAFPRLQQLVLSGTNLTSGRLLDIQPGALPRLRSLELTFPQLATTLPVEWGIRPDVLPALETLSLQMQITGQLPHQWALGFQQLTSLVIEHTAGGISQEQATALLLRDLEGMNGYAAELPPLEAAAQAQVQAALPSRPLPPAWAGSSAFPKLSVLDLFNLGLSGPIPDAWQQGGFPSLQSLSLAFNQLTGTLPQSLFENHPSLQFLLLGNNRLSGTLPDAWGAASKAFMIELGYNNLTGPAFPPGWLAQDALPNLTALSLSGNPGVVGTLPANLTWPLLKVLSLAATGVEGAIPANWCLAPFSGSLQHLYINHTDILPDKPLCTGQALAMLTVHGDTGPNSSTAHSLATTGLASVAALLPLAALLAAALGRVLWQRRLQQLRRSLQQKHSLHSTFEMHQPLPLPRTGSVAFIASEGAAADVARRIRQRRHRLASLLSSASTGQDAFVDLATLEGSPDGGLAHRLASVHQSTRPGQPLLQDSDASLAGSMPLLSPPESSSSDAVAVQLSTSPLLCASGPQNTARSCGNSGGPHIGICANSCGKWGLQLFHRELELVTGKNGELVVLGEGAYSVVFLGLMQKSIKVAVKVYELLPNADRDAIWREITFLQQCTHNHILPLYGVAVKGQLLLLALKFMPGGSLRSALQDPDKRKRLQWAERGRQVALHVAEALVYLHTERHIMHSDLKASNVLLSGDLKACIGDFGMASMVGSQARSMAGFCCTHAAPEQLLGERCTVAADIYSLGILLIELTTQRAVDRRGEWRLPSAPQECPQDVLELVQDCISVDPRRRPTATQVLCHLAACGSGDS